MLGKLIVTISVFAFLFSLNGCATGPRKHDLEMQGLRNQISVLETQLQSKNEEIGSLKESLAKVGEEKDQQCKVSSKKRSKVIGEVKSRPKTKQIQLALRNAGYNPGPIDGRPGAQTRDAIKAFQAANGLIADGKVGKQTWSLLKEYLYKKVK